MKDKSCHRWNHLTKTGSVVCFVKVSVGTRTSPAQSCSLPLLPRVWERGTRIIVAEILCGCFVVLCVSLCVHLLFFASTFSPFPFFPPDPPLYPPSLKFMTSFLTNMCVCVFQDWLVLVCSSLGKAISPALSLLTFNVLKFVKSNKRVKDNFKMFFFILLFF